MTTDYAADDLNVLEGLEAVRKRPGMYIGSTDSKGINHLLNEIVDNSTDEAVAGHASQITVTLFPDKAVEVTDNGRGIPTGINKKTGMSGLKMALSLLHAGGKFSSKNYNSSGGLHGVGSSAVNALSYRMDATVRQNNQIHSISFEHGISGKFAGDGPKDKFVPGGDLKVVGKMKRGEQTGTTIKYWYDERYFETGSQLDLENLKTKLRNAAFLVPNATYILVDKTTGTETSETFHYPHGLVDMVDYLTPSSDKPLCDTIVIKGEGKYKENAPDENGVMQNNVERTMEAEIALRWGTGYDTTVDCFTNTIRNIDGGAHRQGFDRGVNKAITDAIKTTRGLLKAKEETPILEDILEGLTAVVHVKVPEPKFTSQTKDRLSTTGVTRSTQTLVEQTLKSWIETRKTKTEARVVLGKIVEASRVRLTQKQQKETARRKTALEGASMPAKLVDCRSTGVGRSELFIVEGDSALGCFTGDTLVATVEGPSITFEKLVKDWERGITHYGYASTLDGHTKKVPLNEPRITKKVNSLVEIMFDNGEIVTCTPEHLFLTNDGTYVEARKIWDGFTLMPMSHHHRLSSTPKVESVKTITVDNEPVYDLTVEKYHNFALETDVFVHNSARVGRSAEYQALLPIRGKVLNVQKASMADMLKNTEITSIIQTLGAGSGRSFDLEQMRYGRVIIMADADTDGSHIRCLLITLIHKLMRPVIEDGRLFTAMPPLHKISVKGRNPETVFTYTQKEMETTVARLEKAGKQIVTPVPRFKGLGEMNASELWDTTMDPSRRSVRRISINDVLDAENMLELAMGNRVEPRRDWIVDSSNKVDRESIDA